MTAAEIRNKSIITKNKILWKRVLMYIKNNVTDTEFITWFLKTALHSFDGVCINISVATQSSIQRLENKYFDLIKSAINSEIGNGYKIFFKLDTDLLYKDDRLIRLSDINKIYNYNELKKQVYGVKEEEHIFSKNTNKCLSLSNIIVGQHNRIAYACIESVLYNRSTFNPILIYSKSGLGKTHLLQGLYNDLKKKNNSIKVVYNTAEKFTTEIVDAMIKGQKSILEFRQKYRSVNILIIDDVQFISGKEKTQEEFFHLFNVLFDNKKQIILSSDCHPNKLDKFDMRLISRFSSGIIVDIVFPDRDTLVEIIKQKIIQNNLFVDIDTINYLSNQKYFSIRQIEGIINSLYTYLSILKLDGSFSNTKPLIDKILNIENNNNLNTEKKSNDYYYVIEYIANRFNIQKEIILSKDRSAKISFIRSVCIYVLKEKLNMTFEKIGTIFNRNHATIIHCYNKIKKDILYNDKNSVQIKNILDSIN